MLSSAYKAIAFCPDSKNRMLVIGEKHYGIEMRTKMQEAKKKAGATKHCCWGICPSDSRYADKLLPEAFFIRFPKPGKVKESTTDWEKQQEMQKTIMAKQWIHTI